MGAGIGAVAGGGLGAAIGAGAGLAASGIGVITTRGRPTEVYPETMVTFRLDAPVTVSTTQSAAAFHYATQEDYGMPETRMTQGAPRPVGAPYGAYGGAAYAPGYGAYPYPYVPVSLLSVLLRAGPGHLCRPGLLWRVPGRDSGADDLNVTPKKKTARRVHRSGRFM